MLVGEHQCTHEQIGAVRSRGAVPHALGKVVVKGEAHRHIGGVFKPVESVFCGVIDKARQVAGRCIGSDLADFLLLVVIFYRKQSPQSVVGSVCTGGNITGDTQFLVEVHDRCRNDTVERPHAGQLPQHGVVVAVFRNVDAEEVVL